MKIIDRYLMMAVLVGVGAALIIIVTLASFFTLLGQIKDVTGSAQYDFSDAIYYVIMTSPRRMYEVFPISVLIGSLFGLGALAASSELIVIRAAGVSIGRITMAVLTTGVLLMMVDFANGEWLAPYTEQLAQENRVKKRTKTKDAQGYIDLKRKYGFWARKKNNIIRIRKVANLHSLIGVDIYTFNQNRKLISVVSAGSAKYEKGRWTLTDVRRSRLSEDEVQIARFKTMAWGKLIEPDQFKSLMVEPENQALSDLKKYIANLEANRTNADQYRLAYWIKIFKPFSTLVMMLIAIPFIFRTIRTTNTGQRLFFGVLIGLIFYMFNQGMNSVALVSGIPPVVSAALPSLIFGAIGIYFIRRVG